MIFDVKGEAEINRRILNLIQALPDEIDKAMIAEADDILAAAKADTPYRDGPLRDSGKRHEPKREGFTESVEITFGTPDPYYAIYVHENLLARHEPPYGTGGHAKFLETAVNNAKSGMSTRIGRRIKLDRMV